MQVDRLYIGCGPESQHCCSDSLHTLAIWWSGSPRSHNNIFIAFNLRNILWWPLSGHLSSCLPGWLLSWLPGVAESGAQPDFPGWTATDVAANLSYHLIKNIKNCTNTLYPHTALVRLRCCSLARILHLVANALPFCLYPSLITPIRKAAICLTCYTAQSMNLSWSK